MSFTPFSEVAPAHPAFAETTQALAHSPLPPSRIESTNYANPALINLDRLRQQHDPLPAYQEPLGRVMQNY